LEGGGVKAVLTRVALFAAVAGCTAPARSTAALASTPPPVAPSVERLGPIVDHHQHLLSSAVAELIGGQQAEIRLPSEIRALLQRRVSAWNEPKSLAPLYDEKAILVEDQEVIGRTAVSEHVGTRFGRPYAITPLAYSDLGTMRQVAAYYTRGEGAERTNVGATLITFVRGRDHRWRIASETMKFPGPGSYAPIDADRLVKMLDEAAIERAVVLSIAYLFDSPFRKEVKDKRAKVRAENDWTAAQIARHPTRLVGFCSVNPLSDWATAEIERCARDLRLSGLKLHFGNSQVDVKKADHRAKVERVFALANRLRLPMVAHLWTGGDYGTPEAEIFLNSILPAAPDVVVQIAHLAGAGPGWTDSALEVFANAVEAGDPRVRNVYFEVATAADLQKHAELQLLAKRIRQIGPSRILYASDSAFGGNRPPDEEWGTFRGMVPLTDPEFAIIRDNVAPYLRR
jgi:predicted TIM-barrel fold metal-dependent hydrolase